RFRRSGLAWRATMTMTVRELAERIGAALEGDSAAGNALIHACASLEHAGPGEVAFLANARYVKHLQGTRATAVLVGETVECPPSVTCLRCKDPYFAFRNAMIALHGHRVHPEPIGGTATGEHGAIV